MLGKNWGTLSSRHKRRVLILVALVILLPTLLLIIPLILAVNGMDARGPGEPLPGVYRRYNDGIYAMVVGSGYYRMPPELDTASFRPWGKGAVYMAIDRHHVYCADEIVPDLDPARLAHLGNEYYTDGATTYYCGFRTVERADLPWYEHWYQFLREGYLGGERPRTSFHPVRRLAPSGTPYAPLLDRALATNGEQVYHRGLPMPEAHPAGLRWIPHDSARGARDSEYLGDGEHVYFQHSPLPLSDHDGLYCLENAFGKHFVYLFDPRDGMVYANEIPGDNAPRPPTTPFPRAHAPYALLSRADSHAYHTLWLAEGGVYFYDTREDRVERMGDNPFRGGRFREIAPLVFTDGARTLFVDAFNVWRRSRSRRYLASRHTAVYSLDDLPEGEWRALRRAGLYSVWAKGQERYLFDNYGEGQGVDHTVYRIADSATLARLLGEELGSNEINRMARGKHLVVPARTELLDARLQVSNRSILDFFGIEWFDRLLDEHPSSTWVFLLLLLPVLLWLFWPARWRFRR